MFITDELNPGEMLAELFQGSRVRAAATQAFAGLKHDKDLCPRFAEQLSIMLGVYKAYGHEVHDIQSFRDDGVDILMKYETKDGLERRAGLQIKSEDEFRQWEEKKLSLPQILKAQFSTAVHNVGLNDFYVVLCVDADRHRSRIRTLCSELKNLTPCKIIEPVDVLDFYEMGAMDLWSRTSRLLCAHDLVLEAATSEADAEEPDVAFFTIALICDAFRGSGKVDDARLVDIWAAWEELACEEAGEPDRLSDILGQLENNAILEYDGAASYDIRVGNLPKALCALYFDLKVRAADVWTDPRRHLVSLVGLNRRAAFDDADEDEESSSANS